MCIRMTTQIQTARLPTNISQTDRTLHVLVNRVATWKMYRTSSSSSDHSAELQPTVLGRIPIPTYCINVEGRLRPPNNTHTRTNDKMNAGRIRHARFHAKCPTPADVSNERGIRNPDRQTKQATGDKGSICPFPPSTLSCQCIPKTMRAMQIRRMSKWIRLAIG